MYRRKYAGNYGLRSEHFVGEVMLAVPLSYRKSRDAVKLKNRCIP